MQCKKRVHEILAVARAGDRVSFAFDIFLMTLIGLNVTAVILESVEDIAAQTGGFFQHFELFSVAIFTTEYLLRVWCCTVNPKYARPLEGRLRFMVSPMALVDLLAILPFYLPLLTVDLRFVRSIRLLRVFRLIKMARYSKALQTFGRVFRMKKAELVTTFSFVCLALLFASSLIYFAEREAQPDAFSDIPAAMWWAVVTLTTVGYGDVYPVTMIGKGIASLIAILGIGMIALPTGVLGAAFMEELQNSRSGKTVCPHCGEKL